MEKRLGEVGKSVLKTGKSISGHGNSQCEGSELKAHPRVPGSQDCEMRLKKNCCAAWHRPLLSCGGGGGLCAGRENGLEALSLSLTGCLGGLRVLCSPDWQFSHFGSGVNGYCVHVFLCMWTPEVGVGCICVCHSAHGDQACGSCFSPSSW